MLIADDSRPIRQRLVDRISGLSGVVVEEAVDTRDAFRKLDDFVPDLALLDIRMPGGGGIKVLSAVKKDFPEITVIVITNYPYAQYRRKCMEAGADFFFDKSSEFEDAATVVRRIAEGEDVKELSRRTAAGQLTEAKEALEKAEQKSQDMGILGLLKPSAGKHVHDDDYLMWEKTFDSIPDLVALMDPDYHIVRVNQAMADRVGVAPIEMAGKKCHEWLHGKSCPIEKCPHKAMLKDRVCKSIELYEPHLNGWFHVTVSPVIQNGVLLGAVHIARDITDRKRTELMLKASENRYEKLFESMHVGFSVSELVMDENGRVADTRCIQVNSAFEQLTGNVRSQAAGMDAKEVFFESAEWKKLCGQVAASGQPVTVPDYQLPALGKIFSLSLYQPEEGQVACIFYDVTEERKIREDLVRARDAAEEANETKSRFLANMSHELRTPLNAVIGLAELLQDSPLNAEQFDYVRTITDSGESLLRIISDLLDISRIDLGQLNVRSETVSLRGVIEESAEACRSDAAEKNLEFTVSVNENVSEHIRGDAKRLKQVLSNLLSNAVKFTDEGFVRLTVDEARLPSGSRRVSIAVEDSGIGMDRKTCKKIFEPFLQADMSSTRQHGGSGLGLAISKPLIEAMGGTISVESEIGQGSIFRIRFTEPAASDSKKEPADTPSLWSGMTVCIWDDEPADLRVAEHVLERYGVKPCYIEELSDLENCLAGDELPAAVLCNLDMAGLPDNLSDTIRKFSDVSWIAVSAWHTVPDESLKACFSGFVDRPLRPQRLEELLLDVTAEASVSAHQ